MDPWAVHATVIGVLAGIGLGVTILDCRSRPSGAWISLRGILSWLAWIVLGSYAAASTLTFVLLRHRWGLLPSYLIALPLAASPWLLRLAVEKLSTGRRRRRQAVELAARLDLLSWSARIVGPGRQRLRAEVRARRDLRVRLDGIGTCAGPYAFAERKPDPVSMKSGETALLEVDLAFDPDHPPTDYVLELTSWVGDREGVVSYERVEADVEGGERTLRRPLPPPSPS